MSAENDPNHEKTTQELQRLLDAHTAKRVVVVGTTCTGKSTFLKDIKTAHDMDDLIFPLLTPAETDFVNQPVWTEEIGQTMTRLVRERIHIKPGEPVFGTVVIDADLIVFLKISDELLRERVTLRNSNFDNAKNMQRQIEEEIEQSGKPVIKFPVG